MATKIYIEGNFIIAQDSLNGINYFKRSVDKVYHLKNQNDVFAFFLNVDFPINESDLVSTQLGVSLEFDITSPTPNNSTAFPFSDIVDKNGNPYANTASFETILNNSLGAIPSGLKFVTTDSTLSGKGTPTSPLSVVKKFFFKQIKSLSFGRPSQTTEGLINQQANIFEDYLTLHVTPLVSGPYIISANFISSINTSTSNFLSQMLAKNITDSTQSIFSVCEYEAKDSAGVGVVMNVLSGGLIVGSSNSSTDIKENQTLTFGMDLVAGKQYEFSLQWGSEQTNRRAAIYEGIITCELK